MIPLRHLVESPVDKGNIGLHEYIALEHIETATGRLLPGIEIGKKEELQAVRYEPNDVLFGKLRPYLHKVYQPDRDGLCSAELLVLRPRTDKLIPRYLYYVVLSKEFKDWATATSYGVKMPRTSWGFLGGYSIPDLSSSQQRLIADFLDRETHWIDALVDAKRRMIDLLEEKWQALVTNKTSPRPNSDQWEEGPLGRWWTVIDCKHRTATYVPEGVPIVGTTDVRNGRLRLDKAKSTTEDDYLDLIQGRRKPKCGDIIYSRNASLGQAAFVDTDQRFCMGQDVCLITSTDQDQLFLSYQLANSWTQQQVDQLVVGATFKRINVAEIRKLVVRRPPKDEQTRIARELDEQGQLVRSLTESLESQLDLLSEYRQALITQAVTGQLDETTLKGDKPVDEAVGVIPE